MSKYDSTYSAINAINTSLGYEALNYNSTYGAAKALLINLGGEDKPYDSLYSILVELATMAENGQIGGGSGNGEEITAEDLINEAKCYYDSNYSEDDAKYLAVYDETNSYRTIGRYNGFFTLLQDNNTMWYMPLKEMYYNDNNSQYEYIKDSQGNEVAMTTNWYYRSKYEPSSNNNMIFATYMKYNGDDTYTPLGQFTNGSFIARRDSEGSIYYANEYSSWNWDWVDNQPIWGFSEDSEYTPIKYYIGNDYSLFNYNGKIYNTVYYKDPILMEDYRYELKAWPIISESEYGFGNLNYPYGKPDVNFKKFVIYSGGNSERYRWYVEGYTDDYSNITIDEIYNPQNRTAYTLNLINTGSYTVNLNAPIDIVANWQRVSNVSPTFRCNKDRIKSITLTDIRDDYPTKAIDMTFSGSKSLQSINFISDKKIGHNSSNTSNMFEGCESLIHCPPIDTSSSSNVYGMFAKCYSLIDIPEMNLASVAGSGVATLFTSKLENLTDLGGFVGLKVSINSGFLENVPNATIESLMNVINKLAKVSGKTLSFGSTNLAKLTPEQIAVATNKGWTLI